MMAKKKQITNRTFVLTAVIGSLLIMAMVTANTIWSSRQTVSATDEAVSAVSSFYLEAMADRRAKTITNQINLNFDQMKKVLTFIEDEGIETQEDLRDAIGKVESLLSLNRFALVDEDNVVYTQYTTYTGGSRHAFLSALNDRTISTVSLYGSSKQLYLAIPTPNLTIMGKPFKACFVQIDIKDIVDLLAFDDQGRTYFGLYTKNGESLSGTELGPVIGEQNLFEATRNMVSEEVWRKNVDRFASEAPGSMSFASGEAEETLSYVPIEGTGWEMAVLIRESVIQDEIRDISEKNLVNSRNQILFAVFAVLLLAGILLMQFEKLSRNKLEQEKQTSRTFRAMANTDSMTGVRNKLAYSEHEAAINQRIQDNAIEKLAVVVCDINGLKYVNDNDGHAAGDALIKDACALICGSFTHGAVFRIGGDEFVVLLEGEGFDTMDETVRALNRKVEDNIRENAVVVSVGCAVLRKEDRLLRDVFERADQMMYERKKALKEMGAHTRLP